MLELMLQLVLICGLMEQDCVIDHVSDTHYKIIMCEGDGEILEHDVFTESENKLELILKQCKET